MNYSIQRMEKKMGGRSEENRVMGFGEYHHWAYGKVFTEQPHYATYVSTESGRSSDAQKLLSRMDQIERRQHPTGSTDIEQRTRIAARSKRPGNDIFRSAEDDGRVSQRARRTDDEK